MIRCERPDAAKTGVIIREGPSNGPLTTCTAFVEMAIRIAPRRRGRLEIGMEESETSNTLVPTIFALLNPVMER
jgi:hypothetical protein